MLISKQALMKKSSQLCIQELKLYRLCTIYHPLRVGKSALILIGQARRLAHQGHLSLLNDATRNIFTPHERYTNPW